MMDMAERINSTVIAEGIETETELNTLQKFQVPLGQGFFISRPMANPMVK
jgi:EAL domain-containing protein (putative c-di-GMP-specific phosphodiesterase class I)